MRWTALLFLAAAGACSSDGVAPPIGQDDAGETVFDDAATAPDAAADDAAEPQGSPPTAVISADPIDGQAPVVVHFDGSGSSDPDGDLSTLSWDFGDSTSAEGATVEHTYDRPGSFHVLLTVTDSRGTTGTATVEVRVTLADCPTFARGVSRGFLGSNAPTLPDLLIEVSGMVASRRATDLLWVHNDSGDGPRIYAINDHGAVRAGYELVGAQAVDWEDITIGPGPTAGVDYIYVGDIGDNQRGSDIALVYRIPEPTNVPAPTAMPSLFRVRTVETIVLEYGGGRAFNAESMMVDPRNGDLYIVTKSDTGVSKVFRAAAPLNAGAQTLLEDLGNLIIGGEATGADIAPSGEIVIRTYQAAQVFRRPPGLSVNDALHQPSCLVRLANEMQGESISYSSDGLGLWSTTEGMGPFLYFYARQ